MKLLIVSNNPWRASFRQRIEIHLERLRSCGIESEVVRLPRGLAGRLKLFRSVGKFDGVMLHKRQLNRFEASWLSRSARKVVCEYDDAIMYKKNNPSRVNHREQRSFERAVRLADMVIVGNSYLAEHAGRFNDNVVIIPTGLDVSEYEARKREKQDSIVRLVWIGSKSTLKYLARIRPELEQIGRAFDNVRLRIIADKFMECENIPVEKCVWSLERQAADLAECDIGLAPLPDNKFTRGKCGFKILQYGAAGLCVAASPVGVNSKYVTEGVNGFLPETSGQWVERLSSMIKDENLRTRMGVEAHTRAKGFDVRIVGERLVRAVKSCLG